MIKAKRRKPVLKKALLSPFSASGGMALSIFSKLFCGTCIATLAGASPLIYGPLGMMAHYNILILSVLLIASNIASLFQSDKSRFGFLFFFSILIASCITVLATALGNEVVSFSALSVIIVLSLIQLLVGKRHACETCSVKFSLSQKENLNEKIQS
jgi:hypothetical protein